MTVRNLIVPGLIASLLLVACGDEAKPAATPAPVQPAAVKPPAEQAAVGAADAGTGETPQYVYSYSPVGKRDPFRSPVVEGPKTGGEGIACENAGPLGQWGLDQLVLVATVTSDANPIGMVEDPAGKGYIIRRNSPVGSMCGKVTEVLRDCVTVTEYYPTPDGKRVPNPKKLCLKSDESEKGDVDLNTGKQVQ